ncbi:hypothetical protein KM043_004527 [Ampulex compressa]|nr:hypothetical protein KM043_004527 [Ampulex compressa]
MDNSVLTCCFTRAQQLYRYERKDIRRKVSRAWSWIRSETGHPDGRWKVDAALEAVWGSLEKLSKAANREIDPRYDESPIQEARRASRANHESFPRGLTAVQIRGLSAQHLIQGRQGVTKVKEGGEGAIITGDAAIKFRGIV